METGKPETEKARLASIAGAPFLAFDVGAQWVKAAAVQAGNITGVGRVPQHSDNMAAGAVADAAGVAAAMQQAAQLAAPNWRRSPCIVGIGHSYVQAVVTTGQSIRRHPKRPILENEISRLFAQTEPTAAGMATEALMRRTGIRFSELRMVDAAIVDMSIDGCHVHNPAYLCGRELTLSALRTYVPAAVADNISQAAARAGWPAVNLVTEEFALAAGALPAAASDLGGLLLDIGAGSTNMVFADKKGLTAARSTDIGGRSFTRSIALALQLSMEAAEEMKLDYTAGTLEAETMAAVAAAVTPVWQILSAAVHLVLQETKGSSALPARVYLCGGGAALPGVDGFLAESRLGSAAQVPGLQVLVAEDLAAPRDPQVFLHGARDVTLKAIAAIGMRKHY